MANDSHDDADAVESAAAGPPGIIKDDIVFDRLNPYIARAVPKARPPETFFRGEGTYPDIVEGSDSRRTGTSWGVPPVEPAPEAASRRGVRPEREPEGQADPSRNAAI